MLRPGQAIALCVLALLMLGVVMVNSAGMSVDARNAVTIESILLSRSTIYMGLAVVAMTGIALLPIRRLVDRFVEPAEASPPTPPLPPSAANGPVVTPALALPPLTPASLFHHLCRLWPLWIFVAALMAAMASVYLPGIGKEVNHSHRWINLHLPGLDSVQPSELAKWGLIIAIAWYCCRNARKMHSFWFGLLPGLAAAGAVAGFIVLEDLGTGALVGLVATIMLIAGGARIWHIALLAPFPLAGIAAAIITNPYRIHRITSFLDPYQDAQGKGYHMIQSMVAVANGQFFGRGLGHGLQKFGYLPEDTTDFLFAIVCEELGVFGAALVIFLYGSLLGCILSVIRREPSRFLKLVALGVMATVGLQALINLAVVTGLGPTKGIALPLLSSGGTGWILTAASLGLVIAMDRTQGVMQWRRAADRVHSGELAPAAAAESPIEPPAPARGVPAHAGIGAPSFTDDESRFAPLPATQTLLSDPLDTPISQFVITEADSPAAPAAPEIEAVAPAEESLLTTVEPEEAVTFPLVSEVAVQNPLPTADASGVPVGQTGLLFSDPPAQPVAPSPTPAPDARDNPRVIITDDARDWPGTTRLRPA